MTISSAECSTWYAVFLTIAVAVVAVNLLSIILFVKNSNLRTRAMYLVINLTVVDMFVGGSVTFAIVLYFLLYGCETVFFISPEWSFNVLLIYGRAVVPSHLCRVLYESCEIIKNGAKTVTSSADSLF